MISILVKIFMRPKRYKKASDSIKTTVKPNYSSGGLQGAFQKVCLVENCLWNQFPCFTHLQLAISIKLKHFLRQSNKALEDEFLQSVHFPLHRWRNIIIIYEHVPSMFHPAIPCLSQNFPFLGIVKKIDSFTAEAYSHLSNHKGSKVQVGGLVAIIPGVEVGHNLISPRFPPPPWENPKSMSFLPTLPITSGSAKFEWWNIEGFTIF